MHILFVCSQNRWRSLTAETIFKQNTAHQVKSAGTSENARVRVNEKHLLWADLVFVMENKHRRLLQERFPDAFQAEKVIVLDIPDEYQYMDEDLILMLESSLEGYI
jgi:predicted protein tyrosine phosphatase